jgi:oligopeptide transport permease C-like protein/binding-protein-dependent transport system inner membrane component
MATVPLHVPLEDPASVTVSRAQALWRTMKKKPLGAASAALLVAIVLTAIFADVLAPYDPLETHPEIRLSAPSRAHPFGTDDIGRDVLSRIIYGARISLWVGLLAVGIGTAAGMVIGLLCGYCEGRLDLIVQRVMDAIQAIPGLVLALAIVAVLKPNTTNAMLAIAMVIIPGNSRIVRGPGHGLSPSADHPEPHPAQRDRADLGHRVDLARQRDPDRSDALVPRRWHPAADAVLGLDAVQHRPRVHGAGAVARDLSRAGDQPGRLGLQPLR